MAEDSEIIKNLIQFPQATVLGITYVVVTLELSKTLCHV